MLFDRRNTLFLALGGCISACGFKPVYKEGSTASSLQGQIEISLIKGRNGFELREELESKLGRTVSVAPYVLALKLTISEMGLAVTEDEGTTRTSLNGIAAFTLTRRGTGKVIFRDSVSNLTAYGTTSATYPSTVARRDANIRLMKALAAQIANRIAITSDGWAN
ncbi:MAG: LPS assembly lipoprotein LptE [Amylibacter sp.]|nr:LPS assembly lipoprotein LptE [Amylibacter sp.]